MSLPRSLFGRHHRPALLAFAAYTASIAVANWLVLNVGVQLAPAGPHTLSVGFGMSAPSGVLAVGAALTFRDFVQRTSGFQGALLAVGLGAALTAFLSVGLAVASGVTFLVSESIDTVVYTHLRRGFASAVIVSNLFGALTDSVLFLLLAFGWDAAISLSLPSVAGKIEWGAITLLGLAFLSRLARALLNRRTRTRPRDRAQIALRPVRSTPSSPDRPSGEV